MSLKVAGLAGDVVALITQVLTLLLLHLALSFLPLLPAQILAAYKLK